MSLRGWLGIARPPLPAAASAPVAVSDEERVQMDALRRGEAAAFEALVVSEQDRIFDFCVRMLGDREEALDLTQDIFVSVHQALKDERSSGRRLRRRSRRGFSSACSGAGDSGCAQRSAPTWSSECPWSCSSPCCSLPPSPPGSPSRLPDASGLS